MRVDSLSAQNETALRIYSLTVSDFRNLNTMKIVSIIRDRGQLTIPDSIRKMADWVSPMSVVTISLNTFDEIIISPHQHSHKKVDWDALWKRIKRVRSFKGSGRGDLSSFIAKDREDRR